MDSSDFVVHRSKLIVRVCSIFMLSAFVGALWGYFILDRKVNALVIVICLVALLIPVYLAKRGRNYAAGVSFVFILCVNLYVNVYVGSGALSELLLVMPIILVFSAMTCSIRVTDLLIVISLAMTLFFGILLNHSDISFLPHTQGLNRAVILSIILVTMGLAIKILSEDLYKSIELLSEGKQNLEKEVAGRTKELETSLRDVEVATKRLIDSQKNLGLGNAVAHISQELKAPLKTAVNADTAIQMKLGVFKQNLEQGRLTRSGLLQTIDDSLAESKQLSTNLRQVSKIIDDCRDLSTELFGGGKAQVDLTEEVNKVITSIQQQKNAANVRFNVTCATPIYSLVEKSILSRVVFGLLNYVLMQKRTASSEQIDISIERDGPLIALVVKTPIEISRHDWERDTVIGLSKESSQFWQGLTVIHNMVLQVFKGSIELGKTMSGGSQISVKWSG